MQHALARRVPDAATRRRARDGRARSCRRSRRRSRVLLDVLARVVEEADDVVVVERVEGQPAGAADADQARGAEQAQLVRNGRFGQADERRPGRRRSARHASAHRPAARAWDRRAV